ncbi:MAG: hypothetical protein JKY42_09410 [Flavobacteriales bacterium]|nr:hypothetical protein [Flavobacteriales bacterium]
MKYLFALLFCASSLFLSAQHTVVLKSGEKMEGVVMSINNDVLSFYCNQMMQEIQLVDVVSIFFNEHIAYDGSFDPTEAVKKIESGKYVIQYQMKDRKMTKAPIISNATENKGRVVVDVTIDKYGIVHRAKAGATGSTTSNNYLYIKAEFAAKGARFNEHKTGPIETKGTIIIDY